MKLQLSLYNFRQSVFASSFELCQTNTIFEVEMTVSTPDGEMNCKNLETAFKVSLIPAKTDFSLT